jgi:hypothetical protein
VLSGPLKDATRLVEACASEQQFDDAHAISAPLLDLVEVAALGIQRIVGLFVGSVAHRIRSLA